MNQDVFSKHLDLTEISCKTCPSSYVFGRGPNRKGEQLQSEFSSVQSVSHVQLFATPWAAVHKSSLSVTNFWSLLKHMSIEPARPTNHLILCGPLLLFSIFPRIKLFSNELSLHISEFTLQSELVFSKSGVVSG